MYPFFAFADKGDPYNYHLTMLGSMAIWASELASSFVARQVRHRTLRVELLSHREMCTDLSLRFGSRRNQSWSG